MGQTVTDDSLAVIALADAEIYAEDLGREFVEADISQAMEHGIDLMLAAEHFIRTYKGENKFAKNVLVGRLRQYRKLTQGQARAALNIMRQEHLRISAPEKVEKTGISCFNCNMMFTTWDELQKHKEIQHGRIKTEPKVFTDDGEAEEVLEVTESKRGLDLSNLPDGRYALPDASGKNDNIFLMVKRVRRTVKRDRRYVYGKIVTGNEIVVAGTIEVRIWSGDTKEWVGQQKPGDVYRGKYEDELALAMLAPEPFAILFGRLKGHCGMCGKTLTDQISRQIGLGLDCEKKKASWAKGPKYTYIGADRPDKHKANPLDDQYLSGALRRWVEPPKTPMGDIDQGSDDIEQEDDDE